MFHQRIPHPLQHQVHLGGTLRRHLVPTALSHLIAGFALLCAGARLTHAFIAVVIGFLASTALHEMVATRTQP